jgi:hypothetical protein
MTEAEWLANEDPSTMFYWISNRLLDGLRGTQQKRQLRSLERKQRLFGVACCRRIWPLLPNEELRGCVEVAERFADERATGEEFQAALEKAAALWVETHGLNPAVTACRQVCLGEVHGHDIRIDTIYALLGKQRAGHFQVGDKGIVEAEEAEQRQLIRDIFGNPFRALTFSPAWRTDTTVLLAKELYESRDFSAMPILADALQEAGCDTDDILDHCRDPEATHVRGCWVVDLVLGKEMNDTPYQMRRTTT